MGVRPRHRQHPSALVAVVALAALLTDARAGTAQAAAAVPVSLQVQLLSRVVQYERSFVARSGGAVVLVLTKPGNPVSARTAGQIVDSLRRSGRLGAVPIEVEPVAFTTPAALGELVRARGAAIVYVSTGLTDNMGDIAGALSGSAVLSVSATDVDAGEGAVLAFELVEASPRIVVNLEQARRQRVAFSAGLLRLARVIDG